MHLFQGIRHLLWDAGLGFGTQTQQEPVRPGFENRTYRISGWAVIGATAAACLIVWIVGFVVW